jgi:aminopeptidase N
VVSEARRLFALFHDDSGAIPAALKKTVLHVVARHADAATWDQLLAMARSEKTPLVKDQWYALLATTENLALAQRALDLALRPEAGATNSAAMIHGVAQLHPDLAFDFALAHRAAVNEKIDATSRVKYFAGLARESMDPDMAAKVQAYAQRFLSADARQSADAVVADILERVEVRRNYLPLLDAWLVKNSTELSAAAQR